jgi:hypothetical protein
MGSYLLQSLQTISILSTVRDFELEGRDLAVSRA